MKPITRRAVLSCATVAMRAGRGTSNTRTAKRPNFVILLADDLGYGDLRCYGHPTIRTPNLDAMAGGGMRFTQFYAAASVCTPSRAALMTGRLPGRSGLTRVLSPFATGGIPESEITIAEVLANLGYATACVGKWHLGHLACYLPTRHGFERYFGIPYSNDMSPAVASNPTWKEAPPPTPLLRGAEIIEREPVQRLLTSRYTAEAVTFIRECSRAQQPFLIYLPYTFPHVPLFAGDRFRGKSPRGLYGDVVEEIDWSVGEILRTLSEMGQERDTLAVFSSDNGPWLVKKQDSGSAGLLREGKMSTWEGGFRVPFIARWPGRIAPGVVTEAFGTLMDLFPTLVSITGGSMPPGRVFDGQDLSGVLFRNEAGREPLMFYYSHMDLRAVRKGPWKLHLASNSPASGGPLVRHDPPLLFHLLVDPSEQYDVTVGNRNVVRNLLDVIEQHKKTMSFGKLQI